MKILIWVLGFVLIGIVLTVISMAGIVIGELQITAILGGGIFLVTMICKVLDERDEIEEVSKSIAQKRKQEQDLAHNVKPQNRSAEATIDNAANMVKIPFSGYTSPIASNNDAIEDLHINDPDYGLVPEKPVFVAGFLEDWKFLSSLTTENGSEVVCVRLGSMEVDGIEGPVDIYETTSKTGQALNKIYISNYGAKTSERAPAGFYLKGNTNEQVISAQSDSTEEKPKEDAEMSLPGSVIEQHSTPHPHHAKQPPPEFAPISNPDTLVSNLPTISPYKVDPLREKLHELLRLQSQYAEIRNDIHKCANRVPSILNLLPRHDNTQESYYRFEALGSRFNTVSGKSHSLLEKFAGRIGEICEARDKDTALARRLFNDMKGDN